VPAYVTEVGIGPTDCLAERALLEHGNIQAIAFSSTAEVGFGWRTLRVSLLPGLPRGCWSTAASRPLPSAAAQRCI